MRRRARRSALTAVPATLRAAADLSSLFKTDVGAEGLAYGEGARSLFVTALACQCPEKIAGLGAGYLSELDAKPYDSLLAKVRNLAAQRGELANRVALVQRLADAAKGDEKKELAALAASGDTLLRSADAFIDSLRAGETGERSPLFNAALPELCGAHARHAGARFRSAAGRDDDREGQPVHGAAPAAGRGGLPVVSAA